MSGYGGKIVQQGWKEFVLFVDESDSGFQISWKGRRDQPWISSCLVRASARLSWGSILINSCCYLIMPHQLLIDHPYSQCPIIWFLLLFFTFSFGVTSSVIFKTVIFLINVWLQVMHESFISNLFTHSRNYLSSVLIQELFLTWDHDDLSQRAKVSAVLDHIFTPNVRFISIVGGISSLFYSMDCTPAVPFCWPP